MRAFPGLGETTKFFQETEAVLSHNGYFFLSGAAGSCVGAMACGACSLCTKIKGNRTPYLILFFITLIIASILRYWSVR